MPRRLAILTLFALLALALTTACDVPRGRRSPTATPAPVAVASVTSVPPTATPPAPTPTLTATATRRPTSAAVPVQLPFLRSDRPTPTIMPTVRPTDTPRPTSTPTPPWPEPLDKPGLSKLGLHVQWNNSPDIMEYIRRFKPPVVKAVDDLGFLVEVKKISPSTVTIGRFSRNAQNTDGDPVQSARAFVATHLEEYRSNPGVDYWEGLNEPGVRGRVDWYATFEVERVRLMAEQGLRCAVGAFSAGTPEWEEISAFLPAIRAAKAHKGILTLHEYDAPTMQRSVGVGLPDHPGKPDRGILTLRYRWWYEDFLKPQGLAIPLVISEAGVDGGIGDRPGPKGHGWRDFGGYWSEQGLGGDDVGTYLRQLTWYDGELRKDSYVVGCAIFTTGVLHEEWRSYDITPILRQIATYVVTQRAP